MRLAQPRRVAVWSACGAKTGPLSKRSPPSLPPTMDARRPSTRPESAHVHFGTPLRLRPARRRTHGKRKRPSLACLLVAALAALCAPRALANPLAARQSELPKIETDVPVRHCDTARESIAPVTSILLNPRTPVTGAMLQWEGTLKVTEPLLDGVEMRMRAEKGGKPWGEDAMWGQRRLPVEGPR